MRSDSPRSRRHEGRGKQLQAPPPPQAKACDYENRAARGQPMSQTTRRGADDAWARESKKILLGRRRHVAITHRPPTLHLLPRPTTPPPRALVVVAGFSLRGWPSPSPPPDLNYFWPPPPPQYLPSIVGRLRQRRTAARQPWTIAAGKSHEAGQAREGQATRQQAKPFCATRSVMERNLATRAQGKATATLSTSAG